MRVSIKNISEFLVVDSILTNLFENSLIYFLSWHFTFKRLFLSSHCLFNTLSNASQTDYFATDKLTNLVSNESFSCKWTA